MESATDHPTFIFFVSAGNQTIQFSLSFFQLQVRQLSTGQSRERLEEKQEEFDVGKLGENEGRFFPLFFCSLIQTLLPRSFSNEKKHPKFPGCTSWICISLSLKIPKLGSMSNQRAFKKVICKGRNFPRVFYHVHFVGKPRGGGLEICKQGRCVHIRDSFKCMRKFPTNPPTPLLYLPPTHTHSPPQTRMKKGVGFFS